MARSRTYTVQRATRIAGPADAVRARIVDFRRWPGWSPWEELDPRIVHRYGGADHGVGAWTTWKGNRKAGEGRMEITGADDTSVTIDLQFLKPFKSHSTTVFELRPGDEGTEVTWTMTGPNTIMTRVMGVFWSMDKMIGKDFEAGLANLKAQVEADGRTP